MSVKLYIKQTVASGKGKYTFHSLNASHNSTKDQFSLEPVDRMMLNKTMTTVPGCDGTF